MAGVIFDVSFNDMSLNEKFGIGLLSYDIQSASSRKSKGIDIPGRDGTYKISSTFASKKITLSVVVQGATPNDVHKKVRTFLTWLSQQDEPKVMFTDNPDVFVRADLDSSSEYHVTRGVENAVTHLTIELCQYDPFTYDKEAVVHSFEATSGGTYKFTNEGIHTPYTIHISCTESAMTQYMSTSIGHGTADGGHVASNVVLNINGIRQLYCGTIERGDVLTIDGKELTVEKNGVSVITDWEGDIEDFVYGENTLTLSNMEGIKLYVAIEYHRRWL